MIAPDGFAASFRKAELSHTAGGSCKAFCIYRFFLFLIFVKAVMLIPVYLLAVWQFSRSTKLSLQFYWSDSSAGGNH